MTVAFGFPSAEHVTIAEGVPFSSTGRISDGSRISGISSLHRRDQTRTCPRSWRLQEYLEDLDVNGQRWSRHKSLQHGFRCVRVEHPEALHKTTPDAIRSFNIAVIDVAMAQVMAFELIRLVRRERLDGDGQLPVLL